MICIHGGGHLRDPRAASLSIFIPFAKKATKDFHFRTQGGAQEDILADLHRSGGEADRGFQKKAGPIWKELGV